MRIIHFLSTVIFLLLITGVISCGTPTREESRQIRLDTFRSALPPAVLSSFDSISHEEDCVVAGALLDDAIEKDSSLEAVMDSIKHAELIDAFSSQDIVYYFWYYFAYALETGTVRGP